MTLSERRLATRVALAWVLANVLTSAINIATRLVARKEVFIGNAIIAEWAAVVQALAGVVLVIYVSRTAGRFRTGRFVALAAALFVGFEIVRQIVLRAALATSPVRPNTHNLLLRAAIDAQYFFILVTAAVSAALLGRWHERALASAEERAAAEAALAAARVRTLRTQVQPSLIRESLLDIERILETDRDAAEAALLNLSDFLRIALLRARGDEWSGEEEAEYTRLTQLVAGGAA